MNWSNYVSLQIIRKRLCHWIGFIGVSMVSFYIALIVWAYPRSRDFIVFVYKRISQTSRGASNSFILCSLVWTFREQSIANVFWILQMYTPSDEAEKLVSMTQKDSFDNVDKPLKDSVKSLWVRTIRWRICENVSGIDFSAAFFYSMRNVHCTRS